MTGDVWKLNNRDNVLEEVPRRTTKTAQELLLRFAETELKNIQQQSESEVLGGISAAARKKLLKGFDKHYLEPVRSLVSGPKSRAKS